MALSKVPAARRPRKPRRTALRSARARRIGFAGAAVLAIVLVVYACSRHGSASCDVTIYPVRGIDVSRHQGVIDWRAVAASGVSFAWIKATEGGDHRDPAFSRNWVASRAAGVRRGAYHFVYWCRPAQDQAAWFIANVPADPNDLPPVLDVEWNPGSRTCPRKPSADAARAAIAVMLAAMEKAYGKRPVIYAPLDFFDEVIRGRFERYPLWARSLDSEPAAAYGGRRWLIWQHTDVGSVAGIAGSVDENCFNGKRAEWRRWSRSRK